MEKFYKKEIEIRERYQAALEQSLGMTDKIGENQSSFDSFTNVMGQFISIMAHYVGGRNVPAEEVAAELKAQAAKGATPKGKKG